ncbi:hypothetical protein BJ508DRAFT_329219 [Ascobolus immersus RN42]|uniref:VWFA domain-containing protein n=1 Tax=Ascobolus immersus RN42 TaxID=1160509 RepID=A0A3N4I2Y0_ASCIM|nr:hypothetical protein BJ508DRAFT_329219 [Ascobolus immersus RN42]
METPNRHQDYKGEAGDTNDSTPIVTITEAPPSEQYPIEDPPEYTEKPAATKKPVNTETGLPVTRDELNPLKDYEVVVLIDDSFSMERDGLWEPAKHAMENLAQSLMQHDETGIDIHFLNKRPRMTDWKGLKYKEQVSALFDAVNPVGGTPTGKRLQEILGDYIKNYEKEVNEEKEKGSKKPADSRLPTTESTSRGGKLFLLVITDGAEDFQQWIAERTDHRPKVRRYWSNYLRVHGEPVSSKKVILEIAEKLKTLGAPYRQIGIQFLQIGDDPAATDFLEQIDNLAAAPENKHLRLGDIVDTTPYSQVYDTKTKTFKKGALLKVLMGAVEKELDDRSAEELNAHFLRAEGSSGSSRSAPASTVRRKSSFSKLSRSLSNSFKSVTNTFGSKPKKN